MTSFDSIYSLFFSQIDDYELGKMAEEDAVEFLYNQLLISTVNFTCCKKDLSKYTPFDLGEISIIFGEGNQVSILQDLPVIHKNLSFKLYDGDKLLIENIDYKVVRAREGDIITDILITKLNKSLPDTLTASWIFSGEFTEDLTIDEQYILALGMLASWLNHKIFREENLRQVIGDTDYKGYSSANLLSKMTALRESLRLEIKEKMVKYSYKGFKGLN